MLDCPRERTGHRFPLVIRLSGNRCGRSGSVDVTNRAEAYAGAGRCIRTWTWGVIMGAIAAILLLSGELNAPQNGAILAATPFAILMCWCLYKTLRRDYREERRQVQEVMAHDQNVEKQQMQEIMRRHEAGEPVSPISQNPKE